MIGRLAVIGSLLLVFATLGEAGATGAGKAVEGPSRSLEATAHATEASLTVMSFNVEGLPVPARFGRVSSLQRIGEQLAIMRQSGREPNVVLLQEAFAASAKRIATEGGYRYVADGPSVDDVNDMRPPAAAADFVATASHLKGEDDGKWVDSGLRILSDYPIVKVDRLAFPAWACAGYDCLANKGAVIAWIKLPTSPAPVAFIDTHLNSRAASGVADRRSDRAFQMQIAIVRRFIENSVPAEAVAFLGGDFNEGRADVRKAALSTPLLPHSRNTLLDALSLRKAIALRSLADSQAILRRGKDWLYYRGAVGSPLKMVGFDVPFGTLPDGSTLSDHLGYEGHYNMDHRKTPI